METDSSYGTRTICEDKRKVRVLNYEAACVFCNAKGGKLSLLTKYQVFGMSRTLVVTHLGCHACWFVTKLELSRIWVVTLHRRVTKVARGH